MMQIVQFVRDLQQLECFEHSLVVDCETPWSNLAMSCCGSCLCTCILSEGITTLSVQVNIGRVQVMTASDYAPPYWGEIWDF